MESLNRKNAKHDKQSRHHELRNHKWRLRLCRKHELGNSRISKD